MISPNNQPSDKLPPYFGYNFKVMIMNKEEIVKWESIIGREILNPHEFSEGLLDAKNANQYRSFMGDDYDAAYWHIKTEIFFGGAEQ